MVIQPVITSGAVVADGHGLIFKRGKAAPFRRDCGQHAADQIRLVVGNGLCEDHAIRCPGAGSAVYVEPVEVNAAVKGTAAEALLQLDFTKAQQTDDFPNRPGRALVSVQLYCVFEQVPAGIFGLGEQPRGLIEQAELIGQYGQ